MGKKLDIGVSNVARKGKKAWIGVGGKARKIKKMWIGDANGKARLCFSGSDLVSRRLVVSTNNSHAYSDDNGVTWTVINNNGLTYSTSSDTNGERVIATRDGDEPSNPQIIRYTLDGVAWTVLNAITSDRTSGPNYVTYVPELDKFYIVVQVKVPHAVYVSVRNQRMASRGL